MQSLLLPHGSRIHESIPSSCYCLWRSGKKNLKKKSKTTSRNPCIWQSCRWSHLNFNSKKHSSEAINIETSLWCSKCKSIRRNSTSSDLSALSALSDWTVLSSKFHTLQRAKSATLNNPQMLISVLLDSASLASHFSLKASRKWLGVNVNFMFVIGCLCWDPALFPDCVFSCTALSFPHSPWHCVQIYSLLLLLDLIKMLQWHSAKLPERH